jgi:hypothetical protein
VRFQRQWTIAYRCSVSASYSPEVLVARTQLRRADVRALARAEQALVRVQELIDVRVQELIDETGRAGVPTRAA